jgi:phage baseplate assembly protein W
MARALRFTAASKTPEYYSDLADNMALDPITQQLGKVTNEVAVTNSMKRLLLTNHGERFYHPEIGSKINAGLFEMDDDAAHDFLVRTISETLRHCEPRVIQQSIVVQMNPTDNGVYIMVGFSMINIPTVFETSLFVRRTR